MSRKKKAPQPNPTVACPVAGCGRFLAWQPHLTKPGRERAVCACRHTLYHNQPVAERPTPAAAVNIEEDLTDDSTE